MVRDDEGMREALLTAVDELTGGLVDPIGLVEKFSPDQADVHVNRAMERR